MSNSHEDPVFEAMYRKFLDHVYQHDEWVRVRDEAKQQMLDAQAGFDQAEDCRRGWYHEIHKLQSVGEQFGYDFLGHLQNPNGEYQGTISREASEDEDFSIKDFILDQVRDAFPNSLKAADIKAKLKERGIKFHSKTVGMTLYRWSTEGRVRRDGHKWFYVPDMPKSVSNSEDQEASGAA